MVINKAIASLMKEKKITQKIMAEWCGKKRPNDISSRLLSDNMTFNTAIEMLSVMGYEVVIQPRKAGARPQGQIVIERSNK